MECYSKEEENTPNWRGGEKYKHFVIINIIFKDRKLFQPYCVEGEDIKFPKAWKPGVFPHFFSGCHCQFYLSLHTKDFCAVSSEMNSGTCLFSQLALFHVHNLHGYSTLCSFLPMILALFLPVIPWNGREVGSSCPMNPGTDSIMHPCLLCATQQCAPTIAQLLWSAGARQDSQSTLCIWILSPLLVLPLVSVPSLGHGSAQDLIAWTHPEWAIPNTAVFTLPWASEYPAIYRWKTEEKSYILKSAGCQKITVISSECSPHQISREKATS